MRLHDIRITVLNSIIEGVIEHVRISISASLELSRAQYGYLAFAESFSICCYNAFVISTLIQI